MADPPVTQPPPRPGAFYSPVVSAGGWVVTAGQLGVVRGEDGSTRLVEGGTVPQLRQALANVRAVLESVGCDLSLVVKATLFLTDMADFAAANEVWVEAFGDHRPARTAVCVVSLPLGAAVEVEAWAWSGPPG
ncbi:MAG TPA: RidA family protein [Acidimicrobiales bacterium]|nr:RidA family protein [Acidimicrobiales bacterium]